MSNKSGMSVTACALLILAACTDSGPTMPAPEPPLPAGPIAPLPPTPPRTILVGEVVVGKITQQDDKCWWAYVDYDDSHEIEIDARLGGFCNMFDITVPSSGNLAATVKWDLSVRVGFFAKTSQRAQITAACCYAPMFIQFPVDSGQTYRLEIAYDGPSYEFPQRQPIGYTLETALLPSK
jgi:hypothetical protein